MRDKIFEELIKVQKENNINIISAKEVGSRRLGVSHEESDWDVMFLFAQSPEKYATTHGRIGSFNLPDVCDEPIDLHGWNVDKFGDLILDSNPDVIEYVANDSKEYITPTGAIAQALRELSENAVENFNHMSLYHHYISLAKGNWKKYIDSDNDCTKGRQFYIARAISMAQGIRKGGELPPIDARELADYQPIDVEFRKILAKLTEAKRAGHGGQENPDIVGELYKIESGATVLPTEERINSPDSELVDNFIREALI